MDKNKITPIKIIEIFDDFAYYQPHLVNIGNAIVGQEIYYKGDSNQTIAINNKYNDRIWFGITNDIFNSKTIALDDYITLNTSELIELSNIFNFEIVKFPYSDEYQRGISSNYSPLYIVFQWVLGRFYCLIYGSKGTTQFADDILYIHGIWEVELSEEFKKKIFGETL
jgi:hypothetical protein